MDEATAQGDEAELAEERFLSPTSVEQEQGEQSCAEEENAEEEHCGAEDEQSRVE